MANKFAARYDIYIKSYYTESDARRRLIAVEPGGSNETLHPYIVSDVSYVP